MKQYLVPSDYTKNLNPVFVEICNNNQYAALVLDHLYKHAALQNDCTLQVGMKDLKEQLPATYRGSDIYQTMRLLEASGLISFQMSMQSSSLYFLTQVHSLNIHAALDTINLDNRWIARKYKSESGKVAYHNLRAREIGEPATLTTEQWIITLTYFGWRCAYCREKYVILEHFIPLTYGSGTVWGNCVPACHKCNATKGPYHPDALPSHIQKEWECLLRPVRNYLVSRGSEVEA